MWILLLNTQTVEVLGNGDKVVGLIKKDRSSEKEEIFALDGIFVQIGLTANSTLFKELLETNRHGEILTDKNGRLCKRYLCCRRCNGCFL